MSEFVSWINSEEIKTFNPFIRAALAHYHFCLIHPFGDGNGRTARIIEALLLQTSNIKYVPKEISNYYYRNVDDYYISFSKSIKLKKNITPFLEFMLKASVESLQGIKDSIVYFIRKFTLRDFYAFEKQEKRITRRQFDLLLLLLDNQVPVNLKDLMERHPFSILYRRVSTQTARRDLKKLTERNLLHMSDDNKYFLNLRALG
jgi:Fic family protein